MFGSGVIDLVIGVFFVFLIFSLIVSGVNEAITRALAWRSRHLWRSLRKLLDGADPTTMRDQRPTATAGQGQDWTGRLYAHPLIKQLEGRLPTAVSTRSRLARIPSSDFSRALIDLLVPDGNGETTVAQVRSAVQSLPASSPLSAPLLAILSEAGDQLEQLRQNIGDWFDSRMEALSGAYRRHAKYVMVAVGLVVAIVFNVDAIHVTQKLYRDPALRAAVAQQATDLVAKCEGDADPATCARDSVAQVDTAMTLPVGWGDGSDHDLRFLGWPIAAIALGQGAPFWFDLLRKTGRLRS